MSMQNILHTVSSVQNRVERLERIRNAVGPGGIHDPVTLGVGNYNALSLSVQVLTLDKDILDDAYWEVGGNTLGATLVGGTTDAQDVEIRTCGAAGLRMQYVPDSDGYPNVNIVGGAVENVVDNTRHGNVIAGGGDFTYPNIIGEGRWNFIVGGAGNEIRSTTTPPVDCNVIGGGFGNIIEGANWSSILGGEYNEIYGASSPEFLFTESLILGGYGNTLTDSIFSCILIGYKNFIIDGAYTTILSGYTNSIIGEAWGSVIVSGVSNTITGDGAYHSVILSGDGSTISESGNCSVLTGGNNSITSGSSYCAIVGSTNEISASSNSCIFASISSITGASHAAILSGEYHTITTADHAAILCGYLCEITADYGIAAGQAAAVRHFGSVVFSGAEAVPDLFSSIADNEFAIRARGGFRHAYDGSNYWSASISSAGKTTFSATGSGAYFSFSQVIESTVSTGTSPFTISSTTLNTNLNADLLDGQHASAFALAGAWGTGTAGRVVQWDAGGSVLEDSTLVKSEAGILTLSAAGDYTLTIPATGTAALGTGTASYVSYWSGANTLTGAATFTYQTGASPNLTVQAANATHVPLVVKAAAAHSNSYPLIQLQNSSGTVLTALNSDNQANLYIGRDAGKNNTITGRGAEGLYNVFIGDEAGRDNTTGRYNVYLGYRAGRTATTGQANFFLGYAVAGNSTSPLDCVGIGYATLLALTDGIDDISIGASSGRAITSARYVTNIGGASGRYNATGHGSTNIGYEAGYGAEGSNPAYCVNIGYRAGKNSTTSNRLYIANSDTSTPLIYGEFDTPLLIFNSRVRVTDKIEFTQTDGDEYIDSLADGYMDYGATTGHRFLADLKLTADSRKLILGAGDDMSIYYDGANGYINPRAVGSGYLAILGDLYLGTFNVQTDTTTGTRIGTAADQKIGFWNAVPIVQPTTAVSAATFVQNSGNAVNDASTFDGYTLLQVVKALRNVGVLA